MGGISNFQIEDSIKRIGDEDLLNNFVGVFPSNQMNKFMNHSEMIEEKKGKYPFIIANLLLLQWKRHTLVEYIKHWTEKWTFFFNSFGLEGLKQFIIQDDKMIIDKINKSDQKITLCKLKFNFGACKKLSKNEINSLNDTARDFFILFKRSE